MTRRAWGRATLALLVALLLAVAFLPGLSGVRGDALSALEDAGSALTIPPPPSPVVTPVVTVEQLASRAGATRTADRLTSAERALAEGRADEALAAYTAAVKALVPVFPEDGRPTLSARARKVYDTLRVTYDAQEPVSQPGDVRTS